MVWTPMGRTILCECITEHLRAHAHDGDRLRRRRPGNAWVVTTGMRTDGGRLAAPGARPGHVGLDRRSTPLALGPARDALRYGVAVQQQAMEHERETRVGAGPGAEQLALAARHQLLGDA